MPPRGGRFKLSGLLFALVPVGYLYDRRFKEMERILDLKKSISELCKEYPEVMDIMKDLGFDALSPAMLATAGRFMTIPKGAKMKNLDLKMIEEEFKRRGFEIRE